MRGLTLQLLQPGRDLMQITVAMDIMMGENWQILRSRQLGVE